MKKWLCLGMASPRQPRRGSFGGALLGGLLTLIVVGLVAALAVLLAERNAQRFRVRERNAQWVVERGRRFPIGFVPLASHADTQDWAHIYAPIPIPSWSKAPKAQIFSDRGAVDRYLYSFLATWVREGIRRPLDPEINHISIYLQRLTHFEGLSHEQREDLRRLGGDAAYRRGEWAIQEAQNRLHDAQEAFKISKESQAMSSVSAKAKLDVLSRLAGPSCLGGSFMRFGSFENDKNTPSWAISGKKLGQEPGKDLSDDAGEGHEDTKPSETEQGALPAEPSDAQAREGIRL